MGRPSKQAKIEAEYGKPIREVLTDLYSKGNIRTVAAELEVDNATILHWLKDSGIQTHNPHGPTRVMPPDSSQLQSIIDNFILAKQVEGKTNDTILFYRNNLHRFLWWLNHEGISATLKELTSNTIRQFLYYIQTTKVRFGGLCPASRRQVRQATIDAYWRVLQSLCKWLVVEGIIKEKNNPIKPIQRPRQPDVIIPDIPKEDLITIIEELSTDKYTDTRNKAFLLVLLDTGIRLKECLGLTLDKININESILKVFGKGQKERKVRISEFTKTALITYMNCRPQCDGALWLKEDGEPLIDIDYLFRRLKAKYPHIEKLSPHVFRHTFAIDYLRAGGEPYTLQMLGGWANLNMPRKYAAALKQEDALKIHEKASPVEFLLREALTKKQKKVIEAFNGKNRDD